MKTKKKISKNDAGTSSSPPPKDIKKSAAKPQIKKKVVYYDKPGHLSPRHFLKSHLRSEWEKWVQKLHSKELKGLLKESGIKTGTKEYLESRYDLEKIEENEIKVKMNKIDQLTEKVAVTKIDHAQLNLFLNDAVSKFTEPILLNGLQVLSPGIYFFEILLIKMLFRKRTEFDIKASISFRSSRAKAGQNKGYWDNPDSSTL